MTELTYVVRDNETLESIAEKFQIPIRWLKESNGIYHNRISKGDVLRITCPTNFNAEVIIFSPLYEKVFQKGILRFEDQFIIFDEGNYQLKIELPNHIECAVIEKSGLFEEYQGERTSDTVLAITYYKNPPVENAVVSAFFCGQINELTRIKDEISKRYANCKTQNNLGMTHSKSLSFNTIVLNGKSRVITKKIAEEIHECLPRRLSHATKYALLYQMSRDGCSYDTMYKKIGKPDPIIFIIKTSTNEKFGAFFSTGLHCTTESYGNRDTILFKIRPDFQAYYVKKDSESFICSTGREIILGGESKSAIWIDENLYQGISEPCPVFNSPQLSSSFSFSIIDIEIWKVA